ncbi:NTP pyrophosphatase (Non-canonical NTP hydrolase) [Clostridium neonatale]|uniref:hypothetical protein n=1 Tax=Clostridium neonatale TaxID=137838 RepID=UPI00291BB6E8|nr:hypothetical protein [Clostridium neonatale]CAI3699264.1 NTP pyrophosphatase (Non-canonical NTP hydrolase) [Clostridium neonatale]
MKLLMHILKENKSLGIDNTTLDFTLILVKLREEYQEVIEAAKIYDSDRSLRNLKEIVRETFDLIQVCILILWRCNRKAGDFDEAKLLEEINIEHKDKLISERHWIPETGIEIDIKE